MKLNLYICMNCYHEWTSEAPAGRCPNCDNLVKVKLKREGVYKDTDNKRNRTKKDKKAGNKG